MDIYWIRDKKQHGPATVPDIISLVQMGELTPDTPGWHAGCDKWLPLRELPALVDFLGELHSKTKGSSESQEKSTDTKTAAPSEPSPTLRVEVTLPSSQAIEDSNSVSLPLPRTRLIARLIDSALYAALASGFIYLLGIPYTDLLLPLFWAPMILLEAALLTYTGTTPGKRLMGIAVSTFGPNSSPMTLGRALFRSLSVYVMGMGCYLFPVGLVTMLIGYFFLTRRGMTMWDAQCMTLPLQRRQATARHFVIAGVIIYASLQLMAQAFIRTPGTLELMEQASPEMTKTLREMMPELNTTPANTQTPTPATRQPLQ